MAETTRESILDTIFSFLNLLLRACIVWKYWNWFITPIFPVAKINLVHSIGIWLLAISLHPMRDHKKHPWKLFKEAVTLLSPPDKVDKANDLLERYKEHNERGWTDALLSSGGCALLLLIGFILQRFI